MLGVYDRVEDIDLDELPEEFVLKPNHESGRVILCHDKREIDWRKQADVMKNWLRENYYYQTGEWQYKDIPPILPDGRMAIQRYSAEDPV